MPSIIRNDSFTLGTENIADKNIYQYLFGNKGVG
jgi:hypothetical protein